MDTRKFGGYKFIGKDFSNKKVDLSGGNKYEM
jgi:hypothetical protein